MKIKSIIGLTLTLALVLSLIPATVLADSPSPPNRFYGTVTYVGTEPPLPVPDGIPVVAYVDGVENASCLTFDGWYGSAAGGLLDVHADPGDEVVFYVDGQLMEQTALWKLGEITPIDFQITGGDLPPPTPTLLAPADGSGTNDSTPTFEWEAGAGTVDAVYKLQVDDDIAFPSPAVDETVTGTTYEPVTALPDDIYYWRVRAENSAGESDWTIPWMFYLDTVVPTVENTVVPPPETNDNTPSFEGNADGTGSPVASVEYRVDEGAWTLATFTSVELSTYNFTVTPSLPDGPHTVDVRATDLAGNVTPPEGYATYTFEVDTGAPSVTIDPLVPDPTTLRQPTFTGTATDAPSTWITRVQFQVDGVGDWYEATPAPGEAFDTTPVNYVFTVPFALADGPHYVWTRAFDAAGNLTAPANYARDDFDVDATPPIITRVQALDISAGSAVIIWETDDNSTSWVDYGTVSGVYTDTAGRDDSVIAHNVKLEGLNYGTTYYYVVRSADYLGNEATSAEYSFTTTNILPPVITDVTASNIAETSADISWTTDQLASTQMKYGTAPGVYNVTTPLDGVLVTDHIVSIGGLTTDTTYYYVVMSINAFGMETVSGEYSFTTLADTTPPVISDIDVTDINSTEATVNWDTNEPATTQVQYRALGEIPWNTSPLSTALIVEHSVVLSGLMPDTVYQYQVMSSDAAGNPAISPIDTFTTLPDTTPPVISDVQVAGITDREANVYWNTDEGATTQVVYSTTSHAGDTYADGAAARAAYGAWTPENSLLVFVHGASLGGLNPSTTYYYRVISRDFYTNEAISVEHEFTTDPDTTPPVITNVQATDLTERGANVYWNTDEGATSQVVYGTTSHAGDTYADGAAARAAYGTWTPENPLLVYIHGVAVGGLLPDTIYYYRVISKDAASNEAISAEYSFQTLPDTTPPVISSVQAVDITDIGANVYWNTNEASTSQVVYDTSSHAGDTYADGAAARAAYGTWTPENPLLVYIHGVALGGLLPDTTYYYRVISTDAAGNDGISVEHSFTTLPDTTPPVISAVLATDITDTGANVYWNTDEESTTQVVYSTTSHAGDTYADGAAARTAYGTWTPENPLLVYIHGVAIGGLLPDTTYYYRVISTDAAGNDGISAENSFTTLSDTTPPVISAVLATDITETGANVYWNTDEASTTQVVYSTASHAGPFADGAAARAAYGDWTPENPSLVYIHGVALGGLLPDTMYYYRVISKDAAGNEAISAENSFTTLPDTTPPTISGIIVSNITDSTAIIYWFTNEPSTSQVEYGETVAYGMSTPLNPTMVYFHGVVISGLDHSTTYHFRVKSRDAATNEAVSTDDTFTTLADSTPPDIFGVEARHITGTSALIYWATNERSDTQVVWDTGSHAGPFADAAAAIAAYGNNSLLNPNKVFSHSVMLIGLSTGTHYYYRVLSADATGNLRISDEYEFDTLADTTPPVISGVGTTNVTDSSAVVLWLTDEPATSQAVYSTTSQAGPFADGAAARAAYGNWTTEDTTETTHHGAVVTGLSSSVTYYYRVISRDGAGNETVSDEFSFITHDVTPPAILWSSIVAPSPTAVVAVWLTDENSTSQVVYSTTSHAGNTYGNDAAAKDLAVADYGSATAEDGTLIQSHGVVVSGLTSGTTYYCRVISHDAAGNYIISAEMSFSTT